MEAACVTSRLRVESRVGGQGLKAGSEAKKYTTVLTSKDGD